MSLTWAQFNQLISKNAAERGSPVSGTFELTSRCNFQCRMCYICRRPNDMDAIAAELTAGEWIRMGREARDAGMLFLVLTGGEVFLRKDFQEIYAALAEMGFNLTIYTNASLITPEKARWLGRIPPSKVSVTVYGASRETYQRVTGFADAFDRTIRGLDALKEQGIKVEIKTTVVQGNYQEFTGISDIAKRYGIGLGVVNYISPRREGSGTDPVGNRLSPEEIVAYEKRVEDYNRKLYLEETESAIRVDRDNMLDDRIRESAEPAKRNPSSSAFRCLAGQSAFWLTWDGRMTPCGLLDNPAVNPLKAGFRTAWDILREGCSHVPKCGECEGCTLRGKCMTCPARLMTETGSFERPAPYLCGMAKNRELSGVNF